MGNEKVLPAQSQSPTPKKPRTEAEKGLFDFPTAMKNVSEGHKISKKEWANEKIYGILEDDVLILYKEGAKFSWVINGGDLGGDDYFIVK